MRFDLGGRARRAAMLAAGALLLLAAAAPSGVAAATYRDCSGLTLAAGATGVSYTHTLVLVQDSTGSRTMTWPTGVKWNKGTKPTLSTAASSIDLVHLLWTGAEWVGLTGGLALA